MAMTPVKSLVAATAVIALLAGCEETLSNYGEAGSGLDQGSFGDATANNTAYHTGEKIYVISLAERFAKEVPDTITFAFNSATLDAQARAALDRQAHFIRQFPEVRFRVYGHTDLVGSHAYNKSLGLRRAQAVVNHLASRGVSRSRLEAMVSYGETRPLVNTQDRERRNRRTVTEVSGFVQDHPLILNGKYARVVWREYVDSATECGSNCGGGSGLLDGGG
ncbi:OmpA family protein [Sinisalibacter lacisalsi]|uniref:Membrane protein n=1 Tax=Sinisalibacter lacisalsi TaxID=1526570 RepID=A0ABQ1QSX3_9RHOB|nr:OmpA family protein [Sinisalibacter lacisalsi]GGD39855.1 membrane protein [Sinisalibacter lacisalsi]